MERLVREMDKEKFNVYVLYNEITNELYNRTDELSRLKYFQQIPNITLVPYKMWDRNAEYYSPNKTNFFEVISSLPEKIDIFHFHRSGHTEWPITPKTINLFNKVVDTNIFAGSDNTINLDLSLCVSKHIYNRKSNKNNTKILYNGVELPKTNENLREILGISPQTFVFGRIGRDSNFTDIALRAFKEVEDRRGNVKYLIVNPCDLTKKFVESNEIKNVIFLDKIIDDVEISKFFNTIDCLAHYRSDGESCGVNIQEAMIHGKPVISHTSNTFNAQSEVISDCGFVVNNNYEYFSKMMTLIDNKDLYDELSNKSLNLANSKYRIDVITRQLEKYYLELF
jgi:glycosyltransferase involved in cell wall biosynthesis